MNAIWKSTAKPITISLIQKQGYPYDNDIASVSVITDKSIDGDGFDDGGFDKGIKAGLEYIEQHTDKGTDAIFITKEGIVYVTDGIKRYL